MASLLALQYAAIRRRLARGRAVTDAAALALLSEAGESLGVRRAVGLVTVDGIGSPVLFGLLRPRVVLPASALALPAEELRPILLHELAHLRRRDLWVNWAQAVLQSVYWFHPAVWLANARLRRERELIVDDVVLARLGSERASYGASLVSVLKASARRRMLTPGYVGIAEPPGSVASRVRRILDAKRKLRLRLGIVGAAVVLAMGLVLVPQGRAASSESPLIEAMRSVDGEQRDQAAEKLAESCREGLIDAIEAGQVIAILEPRLRAVAASLQQGAGATPVIHASETQLVWALLKGGLVAQPTAAGLLHTLAPGSCAYAPGDPPRVAVHSQWIWMPADVVVHRVVRVSAIDGRPTARSISESFVAMIDANGGPGGLGWGNDGALEDAPVPTRSLTVEVDTTLDQLPKGETAGLPPGASKPEVVAAMKRALTDRHAQKFAVYTETAALTEESGWRGALMPGPAGTDRPSAPGAARPFQATLPNGVTVELVGVGYHLSEGRPWWWPDGSPLARAPYSGEAPPLFSSVKPTRDFLIRWHGTGESLGHSIVTAWGIVRSSHSYPAPAVRHIALGQATEARSAYCYPQQESCSVYFGVAAGAWVTAAEFDGKSATSMATPFGAVAATKAFSDARRIVEHVCTDIRNHDCRLVAVDTRGRLHLPAPPTPDWRSMGPFAVQATYTDLPLAEVKAFRLQVRPYQWAEFRNVSLVPGNGTDAEVGVSSAGPLKPTKRVESATVREAQAQEELARASALRSLSSGEESFSHQQKGGQSDPGLEAACATSAKEIRAAAITAYRAVYDRYPDTQAAPAALLWLSQMFSESRDYAKNIEVCQTLASEYPDAKSSSIVGEKVRPVILMRLSDIYALQGQRAPALDALLKAFDAAESRKVRDVLVGRLLNLDGRFGSEEYRHLLPETVQRAYTECRDDADLRIRLTANGGQRLNGTRIEIAYALDAKHVDWPQGSVLAFYIMPLPPVGGKGLDLSSPPMPKALLGYAQGVSLDVGNATTIVLTTPELLPNGCYLVTCNPALYPGPWIHQSSPPPAFTGRCWCDPATIEVGQAKE